MALVVAVLANRHSLETSPSAFVVDLAAECLLSRSALCVCCLRAELVGIIQAACNLAPRLDSMWPVIELVLVRAGVEVCVGEEVVWVQVVTHGHSMTAAWRLARNKIVC